MAIAVPDVYAACDAMKQRGGKIVREPGPMKFSPTVMAFIEDPDGYRIELIERKGD